MNKKELIDAIAEQSGVTKTNINKVVDSLIRTIEDQVSQGEKVTIVGFGVFEKRDRQARRGHNPKTGEELEIPASSVPVFVPGKTFKEVVNF